MNPKWIVWYRRFAVVSVSLWLLAAAIVWWIEDNGAAAATPESSAAGIAVVVAQLATATPNAPPVETALPTAAPAEATTGPTAPAPTTTPEPAPGPTIYVVQPGDTLYGIARRFNVSVEAILQANTLYNPNLLYSGQELVIPSVAPPAPTAGPVETAAPTPSPTMAPTLTPLPPDLLPPLVTPTAMAAPRAAWPFGPRREGSSLPIPPNLVSVALLGVEGNSSQWRNDSIMLAMLNPDTQRAGIISLPRDSWVAIPGYGHNRINTVDFLGESTRYPGGGPELLKRTLWENYGLPMHYYARVNFDGFIKIIDTLGGVDVTVDCEIADIFPHPTQPGQLVHMDLYPGVNHLDGTMALLYSRSRMSTSDFDRARRQQSVLKGLFQKARSTDTIGRVPQLYQDLREAVQTDLGLTDILALAQRGLAVEPENVQALVISHELMQDWVTPDGAMVLIPNEQLLQQALVDFFNELNQPPARAVSEAAQVVVENQTTYPNWAEVAGSRVAWAGGNLVAVENRPAPGSRTQVIAYTPGKTDTLTALAEAFGIDTAAVVAGDPNDPARAHGEDIRVILGYDFQVCRR